MAQIPDNVLEALARIGYAEKPLMNWLTERLAGYDKNNRLQTDDVQLRISQGRAQELAEILELVKKAPDICRKA